MVCCATAVAQQGAQGTTPLAGSAIPADAGTAEESGTIFVVRNPAAFLRPVPVDFPPLLRPPRAISSGGAPAAQPAGGTERTISQASLTAAAVLREDTVAGESLSDTGPFLDLTGTLDSHPAVTPGARTAGDTRQTIRVIAWLVVVLSGFSLVIAGLRRWQRSQGLLPRAGGQSRVMETLSLGPGRTVSLIELSGIRALVGSDAGGIRAIVIAPAAFPDELSRYGEFGRNGEVSRYGPEPVLQDSADGGPDSRI